MPILSTVRWTQYPQIYLPLQGDTCQSTQGKWPVASAASVFHLCVVAFAHLLPTMGSGRKSRGSSCLTQSSECQTPRSPYGWSHRKQNHCPGQKRQEWGWALTVPTGHLHMPSPRTCTPVLPASSPSSGFLQPSQAQSHLAMATQPGTG